MKQVPESAWYPGEQCHHPLDSAVMCTEVHPVVGPRVRRKCPLPMGANNTIQVIMDPLVLSLVFFLRMVILA